MLLLPTSVFFEAGTVGVAGGSGGIGNGIFVVIVVFVITRELPFLLEKSLAMVLQVFLLG